MRDLTRSRSTELAAEKAGVGKGGVDVAELSAPFTHQEILVERALGLGAKTTVNPSGGALAGNPMMAAGLTRIGEAARRIWDGSADRAVAHATSGPCLQQNLVCVLEGTSHGRAVRHRRHRADEAPGGAQGRLDGGPGPRGRGARARRRRLTWKDIDAVVIGKAPDMFEGVMMPELFLHDALGGAYKPMLRVHTAGSVGGSTGIVAASLVQAGIHDRVLTVAFEKQSESNAMWALSISLPFSVAVVAGAGGFFAPLVRGYIRRSGAPEDTGIRVALKDRQNALKNPNAHLQIPDIDFEKMASSPMLWDPIRYLETCPSSDGACAMVIASERVASRAAQARPGSTPPRCAASRPCSRAATR